MKWNPEGIKEGRGLGGRKRGEKDDTTIHKRLKLQHINNNKPHVYMYMPCCLFDLACFFLHSFSSLIQTCLYMQAKRTWNNNWNALCIYSTSLLLLTCSLYGSGLAGLTLIFDATSVSGDCGKNVMSVHQVTI